MSKLLAFTYYLAFCWVVFGFQLILCFLAVWYWGCNIWVKRVKGLSTKIRYIFFKTISFPCFLYFVFYHQGNIAESPQSILFCSLIIFGGYFVCNPVQLSLLPVSCFLHPSLKIIKIPRLWNLSWMWGCESTCLVVNAYPLRFLAKFRGKLVLHGEKTI